MFQLFKKTFDISKKVLLVIITYVFIMSLFLFFINKDNPKIKYVDPNQAGKEQLYKTINDPQLNSSRGGKMFIAFYSLINCRFIGEGCTKDKNNSNRYYNQSILSFVSKLVILPYSSPPASGLYWVSDTLANRGFISKAYASEGIGFAALKPFISLWSAFRNFTYIILVIILIAIGFMIMFRMKINAQTVVSVENALPKIIITLILITFSYPIAGFMIDIMYLLMLLIIAMLSTVNIDPYTPANTFTLVNQYFSATPNKLFPMNFPLLGVGNYMLSILPVGVNALKGLTGFLASFGLSRLFWNWLGVDQTVKGFNNVAIQAATFGFGLGDLPSIIATILFWVLAIFFSSFALPLVIGLLVGCTVVFMFFRLFFILLSGYINILLLIIFSPVILMFEAIPGRNTFGWWFKNLLANLIVFPFVMLIIMVSDIIIKINAAVGTDKFWAPPFLYPLDQNAIVVLFGLGLYMVLPDFIKLIKEALGAKGLPVNIGLGAFFAGGAAATGGVVGALGQVGSISLGLQAFGATGGIGQIINKFKGQHPEKVTTPLDFKNKA